MTDLKRIAVVPGDGIGPEVIDAGLAMLKAATEKEAVPLNGYTKTGAQKNGFVKAWGFLKEVSRT